MSLRRREFCKLIGVGSAAVLAGASPVLAREEHEGPPPDAAAVLVDTTACIACRKCEWACNQEHKLTLRPMTEFEDKGILQNDRRPEHDAFTVVNHFRDPERPDKAWTIKLQCLHCVDPACASACLVGALQKQANGPVSYDAWKCIGCRYCMVACPFQIPAYEYHDPVKPRVRKCTFCAHRLEQGQTPACVSICPNEALTFGTRREILDAAHTRIQMNPGRYLDHVYGETEIGGTSWVYLAPVSFLYTGLPALDDKPTPHNTEPIQHAVFKAFVPPLALYGLLGLVMHSLRVEEGGEAAEGERHE